MHCQKQFACIFSQKANESVSPRYRLKRRGMLCLRPHKSFPAGITMQTWPTLQLRSVHVTALPGTERLVDSQKVTQQANGRTQASGTATQTRNHDCFAKPVVQAKSFLAGHTIKIQAPNCYN